MEDEDFKCGLCGETFTKGRPDEEAVAETRENFGEDAFEKHKMAVVCDDCYEKMVKEIPPKSLPKNR